MVVEIGRTFACRFNDGLDRVFNVHKYSDPVSAQRCPPVPARAKGPLVWLDIGQQELDDAYDNDVYEFNATSIEERPVVDLDSILQHRARAALRLAAPEVGSVEAEVSAPMQGTAAATRASP